MITRTAFKTLHPNKSVSFFTGASKVVGKALQCVNLISCYPNKAQGALQNHQRDIISPSSPSQWSWNILSRSQSTAKLSKKELANQLATKDENFKTITTTETITNPQKDISEASKFSFQVDFTKTPISQQPAVADLYTETVEVPSDSSFAANNPLQIRGVPSVAAKIKDPQDFAPYAGHPVNAWSSKMDISDQDTPTTINIGMRSGVIMPSNVKDDLEAYSIANKRFNELLLAALENDGQLSDANTGTKDQPIPIHFLEQRLLSRFNSESEMEARQREFFAFADGKPRELTYIDASNNQKTCWVTPNILYSNAGVQLGDKIYEACWSSSDQTAQQPKEPLSLQQKRAYCQQLNAQLSDLKAKTNLEAAITKNDLEAAITKLKENKIKVPAFLKNALASLGSLDNGDLTPENQQKLQDRLELVQKIGVSVARTEEAHSLNKNYNNIVDTLKQCEISIENIDENIDNSQLTENLNNAIGALKEKQLPIPPILKKALNALKPLTASEDGPADITSIINSLQQELRIMKEIATQLQKPSSSRAEYDIAVRNIALARRLGFLTNFGCKSDKDRGSLLEEEIFAFELRIQHNKSSSDGKNNTSLTPPMGPLGDIDKEMLLQIGLASGNSLLQKMNTGYEGNKQARQWAKRTGASSEKYEQYKGSSDKTET